MCLMLRMLVVNKSNKARKLVSVDFWPQIRRCSRRVTLGCRFFSWNAVESSFCKIVLLNMTRLYILKLYMDDVRTIVQKLTIIMLLINVPIFLLGVIISLHYKILRQNRPCLRRKSGHDPCQRGIGWCFWLVQLRAWLRPRGNQLYLGMLSSKMGS